MRTTRVSGAVAVALVCGLLGRPDAALAQAGLYAYPSKGQSPQQQDKDRYDCNNWAIGQTGFNPATARVSAPPPSYASAPPPQSGGVFGRGSYGEGGGMADAGKGAALGALGGAIAGNAGAGAAIGALSGLFLGGIRRSEQAQEQQQWQQQQAAQRQHQQAQAQAAYNAGLHDYKRAYSACMSGRGYRVE